MAKGNNVLTTGDVAKICNVAPRTVSIWFDKGLLNSYCIPASRFRRIPIPELARFMTEHNIPWPKKYFDKYIKSNPAKTAGLAMTGEVQGREKPLAVQGKR